MKRSRLETPALALSVSLSAFALAAGCANDDLGPDEVDIGEDEGGSDGGNSAGDETGDGGTGSEDGGTSDTGTGDGGPGEEGTTDDGWDETDTGEESSDTTETGGEMCDDRNDAVLYLSPDDSNSMSSPMQVLGRVLNEGYQSLKKVELRTWEFMNYYGFEYAAAEDGDVAIDAVLVPMDGDRWTMQLAVSSEIMSADERPPINVTLALDTSGSLGGEAFDVLKESCRAIAANLDVGDTISMVEWDVENTWLLAGYEVEGPNDPLVLAEIDGLTASGSTDLHGGLSSGYELAQSVYDPSALNRLVLITDGDANAGVTDIELIAENAEYGGSDGIYLVGAGLGSTWTFGGSLMDEVTDAGKGASVFLATDADAWKVFGDDFINTMAIAARNVEVELTMPPGFEITKFSGEGFSGDPKEIEPQHLSPNDSMVFLQEIETCAPEQATDDAEISVEITWEDPFTYETKQKTRTWTLAELEGEDSGQLMKGQAVQTYVETLESFKAVNFDAQKITALEPGIAALEQAQAALPEDPDLAQMLAVLNALMPD